MEMDFSIDFFRDEVRNGFYIPTAIKQAWAASLTVLSEIDRICIKYGIQYFADWGTILGAVRHGGFVPWDDDLDICMKRDDYVKFRAVADAELPKEFVIHDYEHKEDHWLFLSRVVNQNQICYDQDHLDRYHNFPYMSAVDIFIQDYLYQDEEQERKRCEEIKWLIAIADGIVEGRLQPEIEAQKLSEIEERYHTRIDCSSDARTKGIALYRIAERQMARVPKEEADTVGQIFPWILKGRKGLPKEYYEKIIRLPFENITIPVPAYYDAVLRSRYGNYLEIHKVWTGHDYPYFEKQRENLQAVADFKLPEFTFTSDMLSSRQQDGKQNMQQGDSLKTTVTECVDQLCEMTNQLIHLLSETAYEDVLSLLPECQQLAVDLGTFVEEVKGEERESCHLVVREIQTYCDALYEIYLIVTGQADCGEEAVETVLACGRDSLNCAFQEMNSRIREQIINRREVLFLTTGFKEWKGFADIYDAVISDGQCDVYVIPLPMLFKDSLGRVSASAEIMEKAVHAEEYPASIALTPWTSYDLQLHQPDQIYIQNPYDGENPCLTVPPQYYAKNLRTYTKKLIYVPAFEVDEFTENDYNDVYNMKHYVTAPGVIYADAVFVQSENMKQQYVQQLTKFAGEETRALWEEKIKPMDLLTTDNRESLKKSRDSLENRMNNKKRILYCIGLNELSEHKQDVIECVQDRFEIFKENQESIDVTVSIYPMEICEWKGIDERLTESMVNLIHRYEDESWCQLCDLQNITFDAIVAGHDAYYGSASPLVPMFVHERKPVMIAGY